MDPEQELIRWCEVVGVHPSHPLEIMHRAKQAWITEEQVDRAGFGPVCPIEAFEAGVRQALPHVFDQYDTQEWNEFVMRLWNRWKPDEEQAPCQICGHRVKQQVELAVVCCAKKAEDKARRWDQRGSTFPGDVLRHLAAELRQMLPTAPSEASENDVVRYLRSRAADAAQRRLNAAPAVPPRPPSEEDSEEGESE